MENTTGSFKLNYCSSETNRKFNLARHIKAKHLPRDPNLNKCKRCQKSFSSRSSLSRHLKTCGKSKSEKYSLMKLSCEHCKYKTDQKSNLADHIKAKHLPRNANLNKCKKCQKSFSQQSNLLKHLKICSKSKSEKYSLMKLSCEHCKYKTCRKSALAGHIKAKHLPRDPNLNKCKKCQKGFTTRYDLSKHSKLCVHGKIKKSSAKVKDIISYKCDKCSYESNKKSTLAAHIRSEHSGFYICQDCGENFDSLSVLLEHEKSCAANAGVEQLLSCSRCDFRTGTEADLAKHIESRHTPKCPKCERSFKTQNRLKVHLDNSFCGGKGKGHPWSSYICELCKYTCDEQMDLIEHDQSEHSNRTFKDYLLDDLKKRQRERQFQ